MRCEANWSEFSLDKRVTQSNWCWFQRESILKNYRTIQSWHVDDFNMSRNLDEQNEWIDRSHPNTYPIIRFVTNYGAEDEWKFNRISYSRTLYNVQGKLCIFDLTSLFLVFSELFCRLGIHTSNWCENK